MDAVAGACVAGAMGETSVAVLDGTDSIKEAAGDPPSTGLTEALGWARDKLASAFEWASAKAAEISKSD